MIGDLVEIPSTTDDWASGDRYGQIVKEVENGAGVVIAHLDMDKTGRRLRFRLDRLRVVDEKVARPWL